MKFNLILASVACILFSSGCSNNNKEVDKTKIAEVDTMPFEVEAERFADLQVLRYQVKGFDELSLQQKQLAYYLYEAAMSGRDIVYDQKYKYNLIIRRTIDAIYTTYKGDKNTADWKAFDVYAKRIWFSNGIHHHYSNMKMMPDFNETYFAELLNNSDQSLLPLDGKSIEDFLKLLNPILFDPKVDAKIVNQAAGIDNIKASANNFYEGVSQKEVEDYYAKLMNKDDKTPIMYGLNSKMVKENGKLVEKVWKVGGMYGAAIEKIVYWLEKAATVAENAEQKDAIEKLAKYYKSGDLKDFDEYSIAWVKDINSRIDVVNGFIEVYGDAIGKRGSFESVLSMKDMEATKTIATIGKEAQWFEDNSPIANEHKKKEVKGISAKVITVIAEAGDAAPSTPIGINLPNSNWIREIHGSKSVSLGNIVESYNIVSAKSPTLKEFAYDNEVVERAKKYGALAGNLHTDMHEVIGHASGKINPGVGTPDVTLKNYANCLEEARADLVALYYIYDQKLIDIGVMPSLEVGKTEYDNYILNGLIMQLTRIKLGDHLEEAHMRNRQLVAGWAFEKGKQDNVIEMVKKDGKTYVKVNDYDKLKVLFGQLLKEIQRIKSEGDYKAATDLVETYGVKINYDLHKEVLERFEKLNVAPYKGFIQPKLVPVMENDKITDVKIEYPTDFSKQMIEYGKEYNFLPNIN
ncbi:MAG: dihydrofolate reductase [Bacteroidia bacterium]|nr:dihydrofolate reductase [Bacteroidia bacterium]MCZ2248430.1 dipeptidyl peptidase 3 [Bacteroidia bacterium]